MRAAMKEGADQLGWSLERHCRYFFKKYCEELKHEQYDDILRMTQWPEDALPNVVKSNKEWEQHKRHQVKKRSGTTLNLCGKWLAKRKK